MCVTSLMRPKHLQPEADCVPRKGVRHLKLSLTFKWLIDILIDFNDMSNFQELFYAKMLANHIYCKFIFKFTFLQGRFCFVFRFYISF